jgi:hypothetical protein
MKRQPRIPTKPSASGRALDTRRLSHVRGGDGLGIDVSAPDPTPSFMQQQHNEALIRL